MSREEIENKFGVSPQHEAIRHLFVDLALALDEVLPNNVIRDSVFQKLNLAAQEAHVCASRGDIKHDVPLHTPKTMETVTSPLLSEDPNAPSWVQEVKKAWLEEKNTTTDL